MLANMESVTPIELYWDSQKKTLNDVHETFSPIQRFKPLPDRHPLLSGPQYGKHPPSTKHKDTGQRDTGKHNRKVRYEDTGYDSWEESSDTSDDGGVPYQYPMVMYPMIVAPHPHTHRSSTQKLKPYKLPKGSHKLKKVHYRNTPTFLNSRDNTKHEPGDWHHTTEPPPPDQHTTDLFDPRSNSVLARYQIGSPHGYDQYRAYSDRTTNGQYSDRHDHRSNISSPAIPRAMDEYLNDFVEDIIAPDITEIVRDTTQELVSEHMERAAAFDTVMDFANQLIQEIGPQLVEESIVDVVLEDLLDEEVVEAVVQDESKDIALEVLSHYSDKVRQRDLRELTSVTSGVVQDAVCLDALLGLVARQGQLWTRGEHANKLLDEMILTVVTSEYLNVAEKRRRNIANKPVRRFYEKLVTDVMFEKLLEELSLNLDEDMGDLDEYERGQDSWGALG